MKKAELLRIPGQRAGGAQAAPAQAAQNPGWDPYEVWRTRVLLPRLENREAENREGVEPSDEAKDQSEPLRQSA
ncbi:MAG TPA: hypothetical protein VFY39_13115 [Gammaproteobacteria bacterium]|nr:hypothetical protein [Gammaproteobacteria bacterium]